MYDRNVGTKTYQQVGGTPQTAGNQNWPGEQSTDGPSFPFLVQPESPNAFDLDAQEITTPLLSDLGWTVAGYASPFTAYTRAGNVDLASDPAANTYRSTIVSGELWIQIRPGDAVQIARAAVPNFTYKARVRPARFGGGGTFLKYAYFFVAKGGMHQEQAGVNQFRCGVEDNHWFMAQLLAAAYTGKGSADPGADGADAIFYINVPPPVAATQDVTSRVVTSLGGYFGLEYLGGSVDLGGPVDTVGVLLGGTNARSGLYYLDFIRKQPLNQLP